MNCDPVFCPASEYLPPLDSPEASSQTTRNFGTDFGSCLETPVNNISACKPQGKNRNEKWPNPCLSENPMY